MARFSRRRVVCFSECGSVMEGDGISWSGHKCITADMQDYNNNKSRMAFNEMKKQRELVMWTASETFVPWKHALTSKSSVNKLKCPVKWTVLWFAFFFLSQKIQVTRCFSWPGFPRTTKSVVHFLSACPQSVFGMFVANHVDQTDIEKCTTGSEHSTYSIWEMTGIQGSSGEPAAIFSFLFCLRSFWVHSGDGGKKPFFHNDYLCLLIYLWCGWL